MSTRLCCSCVFSFGFPKLSECSRRFPTLAASRASFSALSASRSRGSASVHGRASRLYLPSFNAFVWCNARRITRVRSAGAKRRAFVPAERFLLRWTERAERVQNTSDQTRPASVWMCWSSAARLETSAEAGEEINAF